MYQENKAEATVTITIVPCVRPSYSHFLPDTAVQSSLRNLLSAKQKYPKCWYEQVCYSKHQALP